MDRWKTMLQPSRRSVRLFMTDPERNEVQKTGCWRGGENGGFTLLSAPIRFISREQPYNRPCARRYWGF